jgi:hypothetical protein
MTKKEKIDTTAIMRINGKHAKSVCALLGILLLSLLWPQGAHASMFSGEALDTAADVLTWIVLVLVPIIGIGLFLMVHILPEKIAEKKNHPQAKAIQTLCLLSLVFGGMLWPIAWLWAYTKPVLYRMAYGTDTVAHGHDDAGQAQPGGDEAEELKLLRQRVAELESKLAAGAAGEGKA